MTNLFLILLFGFTQFVGTMGDLVSRSSYALEQYGCGRTFLTSDELRNAEAFYLRMHAENGFGEANPVSIQFADIVGLGITVVSTNRDGKERTDIKITDDFLDPSSPLYGSMLVGAVTAHETVHLLNPRWERDSGEVAAQIASLESLALAADSTQSGELYWLVGLNFNLVMARAYEHWVATGDPLSYVQQATELRHLPPCYRQPIYHVLEYYMGLDDGKDRMHRYYYAPVKEILDHRYDQRLTGMNIKSGEIVIDDIWRKIYELPEVPQPAGQSIQATPTSPVFCGVPDDVGPGDAWICLPDGSPATVTPTPTSIWADLTRVPKPYITPEPTPTQAP